MYADQTTKKLFGFEVFNDFRISVINNLFDVGMTINLTIDFDRFYTQRYFKKKKNFIAIKNVHIFTD